MFSALCHFGAAGSAGSFGVWGWAGFVFNLVFGAGLLATLALLGVWAIRRLRAPAP